MKKLTFLITFLSLIASNSFALEKEKKENNFFLQSFATIEYSAPSISNAGDNRNFKTNVFEKQIKDFENIAVGFNFRVHKNLGFNVNWQQTDLHNGSLQGYAISQKARFKTHHTNFSALFYAPKMSDILEFFVEAGLADMHNKLTFVDSNGVGHGRKSHETVGLYGAGFQLTPFTKSKDAIRFSVQRYTPSLGLIHSDYTTVRVGYMKAF